MKRRDLSPQIQAEIAINALITKPEKAPTKEELWLI
jgi:hypothetical protein